MKHRMFRIVIAVILVCALLVSWSPIRVSAMALPEATAATAHIIPFAQAVEPAALGLGGTIFCWVAMGLGVLFTAQQAVKAYNAYQDFSGDLETTIYYYPDGSWSYGVDMGFVERVRAWLFKDGILYLGPKIDTSMPASVVEALGVARANGCHYFYGTTLSGGYPFVAYCNKSYCMYLYYIYGSYQLQCGSGGPYTFVYKDETSTWSRTDGIQIKDGKIYKVGENEPVQTTDDAIKLGLIPPPEVDIPTGYPEWHTNSRPATNSDTDEEITVLPIPLNPSADPETQIGTLTQPDIWQGSIADPLPDTDPDTGTDVPPADIADYSIDLTSFFPFCLPFDIYAFFELLAAEPETPHLEFDIELPFMQEPWHVVIDLSAWDSTALLARRLELLAFIIGLCVFTREKFLRS